MLRRLTWVILLGLALSAAGCQGCKKGAAKLKTAAAPYAASGYWDDRYISLEAGFAVPRPGELAYLPDALEEDLVCAWGDRPQDEVTGLAVFMKKVTAPELLSRLATAEGRRPAEGYEDWGLGNEQYFILRGLEAFRLSYILGDDKGGHSYCKDSYFLRGPYLVCLRVKINSASLKVLSAGTTIYDQWLEQVELFEPQESSFITEDAHRIDDLFVKFEEALRAADTEKYLACFHPEYPYQELERQFIGEKVPGLNRQGSTWSLQRRSLVVNAAQASVAYDILRQLPGQVKPADDFKVEFRLKKDADGWRIIDFK